MYSSRGIPLKRPKVWRQPSENILWRQSLKIVLWSLPSTDQAFPCWPHPMIKESQKCDCDGEKMQRIGSLRVTLRHGKGLWRKRGSFLAIYGRFATLLSRCQRRYCGAHRSLGREMRQTVTREQVFWKCWRTLPDRPIYRPTQTMQVSWGEVK